MITLDRNFPPLTELGISTAHLMTQMGNAAIQRIVARTERGIDVHGAAFAPLSADYADAKSDALGHARADLTVSGRMLNDMKVVETSQKTVEIGFISRGGTAQGRTFVQRSRALGAADKAYYHHVAGAGKSRVKREFFDLNDADVSALQTLWERHLDTVL